MAPPVLLLVRLTMRSKLSYASVSLTAPDLPVTRPSASWLKLIAWPSRKRIEVASAPV